MTGPIREAAVAGTWYPGTPARIVAEVEAYLGAAAVRPLAGTLVGLICPHAGLHYSGPVAAYGYSLLRGRKDATVVMVGPSHHYAFDGVALWPRGAFETPLGRVPIDEDLAAAILAANAGVMDAPDPHREEHCLEMQLPFLQHLVAGLRIVPMLMGSQTRSEVEALAQGLGRALAGRTALLLASSDLSHFQPAPVANRMDALVAAEVGGFDSEGLMKRLEQSHEHACGGGPIVAVMKAARALGADRAQVLRYADSGDIPPCDKSRVVGYLSAALSAGS